MPKLRLLCRPFLLVLSLLSACAAGGAPTPGASAAGRAYGAFLQARYADSQFALDKSARILPRGLARRSAPTRCCASRPFSPA